MEKISIIVPVYNSENELKRCIESILNQTYQNIELILINDGSTDQSLKICEKYEEKYHHVKVLTQSNRGQSAARNRGINEATGDLIGFVDSDDFIHPEMYSYLYNILIKNNADLSAVQIKIVKDFTEVNLNIDDEKEIEVVEKENLLVDYMYDGLNKKSGQYSAGRKLFRKHLVNDIEFLENYIYEDILFNYEILEKANRMVKSTNVMYFYFQDSESTMRRSFTEKELDLLYVCDLLIKKAKETSTELTNLAKMKKARSYFSLLAKIAYYDTEINEVELKKIQNKLIKGLRRNLSLLLKSPIPINRKIIILTFSLNFYISKKVIVFTQNKNISSKKF